MVNKKVEKCKVFSYDVKRCFIKNFGGSYYGIKENYSRKFGMVDEIPTS